MSSTEPLTDAEAEAVLLSLASVLNWQHVAGTDHFEATVPEGRYRIRSPTCSTPKSSHRAFYLASFDHSAALPGVTGFSRLNWSLPYVASHNEAKEICERHYENHYRGFFRIICLLCGEEILPHARMGRTNWAIEARRKGRPAESGYVHSLCAKGEEEPNLTGKPCYAGYNRSRTQPVYDADYDPVEQGRLLDEDMRQGAEENVAREQVAT